MRKSNQTQQANIYSQSSFSCKKISNILLYLGVTIVICSLIYMITEISLADTIVGTWLTCMGTGVFFVIMSQILRFSDQSVKYKN